MGYVAEYCSRCDKKTLRKSSKCKCNHKQIKYEIRKKISEYFINNHNKKIELMEYFEKEEKLLTDILKLIGHTK